MQRTIISIVTKVSIAAVVVSAYSIAVAADGLPVNPQARALVMQGGDYLRAKSYPEAKAVLEQALQMEPSNGLIHFRLARTYAELSNNEQALDEYFKALELKPHIPATAYNIANCYQSLGDLDKAIEWFAKYVQEEPGDHLVESAKMRIEALRRVSGKFKVANKEGPDYLDSITGDQGPERWPAEKMPIKVFISAGDGIPGFNKDYPAALYEAVKAWADCSGGRITILVVPSAHEADIVCDWTTNWRDLKPNATGAESGHTDVQWAMSKKDPTRTRRLYSAHIRIVIVDPLGHPVDLQHMRKTCLHETGHALGLAGHSGNPRDIMFFGESSECSPALSERDKETILKLYR